MALVGEGGARRQVVAHDFVVAVVGLTRGHDLVVRMAVEGGKRGVELLSHLGIHVLADERETTLSQIVGDHDCSFISRTTSWCRDRELADLPLGSDASDKGAHRGHTTS